MSLMSFENTGLAGAQGMKPSVRQTIVVEGKDDMSAVLAAVSANVIYTHGYGINPQTLELLEAAYERTGLVIFTDPDHAGRQIRERLSRLYPDANHAYLTQTQAERDGDIGIENAAPADIINALRAAGAEFSGMWEAAKWAGPSYGTGNKGAQKITGKDPKDAPVTMEDLIIFGLAGGEGSAQRRCAVGARLGIGSANASAFAKRLCRMGISREELIGALEKQEQ